MRENTVPLKCQCGKVAGEMILSPKDDNRVICYCDDCQAFAKFLGKANEILDQNAGTDLYQITPDRFKLLVGKEHLACVQLSKKGIKRWYAKCCNTPIGNTLGAKFAFHGVIHNIIDTDQLDAVLGKVTAHCMGRYGRGELPAGTHPKFPLGATIKVMKLMGLGLIFKKYTPNTFFDLNTGRPIVTPKVLSKEERISLNN